MSRNALGRRVLTLWALALTSSAGAAVTPLGPRLDVAGDVDQATILREDFSDCSSTLALPSVRIARHYDFMNRVKYGLRTLVLYDTAVTTPYRHMVAPRQEFTLYGDRVAESPHVTQHASSIFQGTYVLLPLDTEGPTLPAVRTFLVQRFPQVSTEGDEAGSFFLVPLSQWPSVEAILHPKSPAPSAASFRSPSVPQIAPTPGTVRTGRGTYYVFPPSGYSVTIFPRMGAPRTMDLAENRAGLRYAGYASHAAILERMGVRNYEKMSPVEQIHAAIEHTEGGLETFGVPRTLRALLAHQVATLKSQYDDVARQIPEGRWAESNRRRKRDTYLWAALDASEDLVAHLPRSLRWHAPGALAFRLAPRDGDGLPALRVQRPFLVFGSGLRQGEEPAEIRIGETRYVLHLQLAHAYLGAWAFDLDDAGAIGGGLLEYEYDPAEPSRLLRVRVADDGFVSVATGKRETLSPVATEWVQRKLTGAFTTRVDVPHPAPAPHDTILQPSRRD